MPVDSITLALAADGALALDGENISRKDLAEALAERLAQQLDLRLRINAHRATDLRHVLPYVASAEALGLSDGFMMLGDVVATSDPLRDDVAGILAAVPCSRLQVMFDPETVTLNLCGHLPENG